MRFTKVGVVGAGVIGQSVAQALAQSGHDVVLVDTSRTALDRSLVSIANGLRLAAFKTPSLRKVDHAQILARIHATVDYGRLRETMFVIENTTEDWQTKETVYRMLDEVCAPDCVLAVNTSAISIARIASVAVRHPHIVGMHFMNPVPHKSHVEVIRGEVTSEVALDAAHELLTQMGKHAIVVRDRAGFVSNRVMMPMINEAISVLAEGTATAADIDAIFVHCFAHAMGPLATADLIGLDTILRTLDVLQDSYGDPRFQASPLLRQLVATGKLGRKSGAGFFEYAREEKANHG